MWWWFCIVVGACVALYVLFVLFLALVGRRTDARAVAGFVPDCAILFGRLLRDPRIPVRHKFLVGGLALYLATPIDVIPDFIPFAGQLDDAILVILVLRTILRRDRDLVVKHWPGPERSLDALLWLARLPPVVGSGPT